MLALAVALVGAGCGSATHVGLDTAPSIVARPAYVVSHGWHVGLVLRHDEFAAASPRGRSAPAGEYVEVGWGDGDFYPAARGTLALALRAAFRSRSSVLQVVGFDGPVGEMVPGSRFPQLE